MLLHKYRYLVIGSHLVIQPSEFRRTTDNKLLLQLQWDLRKAFPELNIKYSIGSNEQIDFWIKTEEPLVAAMLMIKFEKEGIAKYP